MGVALSGGRHALSPRKAYFVEFYGRGMGFWRFVFYEISRTPFLSYSHFQGVKLKLISRAFCWCIVCFCTSIGSFQILNSKIFRIQLLHPVCSYQDRSTEHFPIYIVLKFLLVITRLGWKKWELSQCNKAECKPCLFLWFLVVLGAVELHFGPSFGPSVSPHSLWITDMHISIQKFKNIFQKSHLVTTT